MDKKEKLEILNKKSDVVNKKLIGFLAIAGGSWAFGTKESFTSIMSYLAIVVFVFAAFGAFRCFLKLGNIEKEMDDLLNDN